MKAAINRLLIIWKSDLSDKIKQDFFQAVVFVSITLWMHHMDAEKRHREKAWQELHKNATSYIEQILETTLYEAAQV